MKTNLLVVLFALFLLTINALPVEVDSGEDAEYGDYFQGDMILNEEQISAILNPEKRNGLINEKFRWPFGFVFYEFEPSFDQTRREYVREALRKIEKVTCIRFYPRTLSNRDYIYITGLPTGCYSSVGRKNGRQVLNLAKYPLGVGCFRQGSIIHEFIHALGFLHQQSASDRDNFVTVIKENILDGREHNFIKYPANVVSDFGVTYDYGSVMHYSSTAFSKNGKETIVPIDRSAKIGQRQGMSPSDIKKINLMYQCPSS